MEGKYMIGMSQIKRKFMSFDTAKEIGNQKQADKENRL